MTQGERIRELRKITGMTMEQFGGKLGVTKSTISNIENGNRNATEHMIKFICREFNVNEEWLRYGTGDMEAIKSNDFTCAVVQNERVRKVRKSYGLTLDKFGERIGLKKSAVSLIESGKNSLTDANIKSICREFNVNEEWLRYGTGAMFPQHPDISYKDRIIGAVTFMSDSDAKIIWEFIIKNLNRKNGEEG